MMKTSLLSIVLLSALVCFGIGPLVPHASAQEAAKPSAWTGQKWEYRVIRINDSNPDDFDRPARKSNGGSQPKLNKLGAEGWELVAVRIDNTSARSQPIFYFKRPLK